MKRRKGFTLIELLVVALILAILMAIALPLYLNAVADSQLKTCRANLQTIANAVQAARVADRGADYAKYVGPVDPLKEKDLQFLPTCPSGGAYSVEHGHTGDATTYLAKCSIHSTFEPGKDSQ